MFFAETSLESLKKLWTQLIGSLFCRRIMRRSIRGILDEYGLYIYVLLCSLQLNSFLTIIARLRDASDPWQKSLAA